MPEISFWNEALHLGQALATGWGGGVKPLETCPRLWPKAGQGVHFPPPEFRKIGEINAAAEGRWC